MRTTREELVREYRRLGWWSDTRITDLFDAAVRSAPCATRRARSPESRRAHRRLATASDVSGRRGPRGRLLLAPAGNRPRARRHPGHATAQRRGVSRAVPRCPATRHHRQPGADAVPAPRTGADRRSDGCARLADGAHTEGGRLRNRVRWNWARVGRYRSCVSVRTRRRAASPSFPLRSRRSPGPRLRRMSTHCRSRPTMSRRSAGRPERRACPRAYRAPTTIGSRSATVTFAALASAGASGCSIRSH